MVVLDHLLFFMRTSLITLALLVIAPHATAQTTHTVSLTYTSGQGAFTPNELTVELGDTVAFTALIPFMDCSARARRWLVLLPIALCLIRRF